LALKYSVNKWYSISVGTTIFINQLQTLYPATCFGPLVNQCQIETKCITKSVITETPLVFNK